MNWEAIGAVGEILGAIAVFVTLWYVAIQVRQSNRLAEAAAYQSLGESTAALWFGLSGDGDFNELWLQSLFADSDWWAAQSPVEIQRIGSHWVGQLRLFETLFLQVELGLLDPAALDRLGYAVTRNLPVVQSLWPMIRTGLAPEFQAYITQDWPDDVGASAVIDMGRRYNFPPVPDPTRDSTA